MQIEVSEIKVRGWVCNEGCSFERLAIELTRQFHASPCRRSPSMRRQPSLAAALVCGSTSAIIIVRAAVGVGVIVAAIAAQDVSSRC